MIKDQIDIIVSSCQTDTLLYANKREATSQFQLIITLQHLVIVAPCQKVGQCPTFWKTHNRKTKWAETCHLYVSSKFLKGKREGLPFTRHRPVLK